MHFKKVLVLLILMVAAAFPYVALSQQFSYVYIQGDKQTPIYVKLEGQMQPRYGKNYSIISQLAPGVINIEVLFQQNIYPPQRFAIKVPEKGSRAFLLTKKGNSFSLYDLQQQFYLPAGNSAADDHIPTYNPSDNYVATNSAQTTYSQEANTNSSYSNTYQNTQPETQNNNINANTNNTQQSGQPNTDPQFIDNIELNNERTLLNKAEPEEAGVAQNPEPLIYTEPARKQPNTPRNSYSTNGDCPQAMTDGSFQDLYDRMNGKTDKTRLKFLLGRLDNCYSTSQIRMLAKGLSNDPERYAFLKQAYPRVTDQGNFAALENLLTTREWKDYFRLIMP